MRFHIGPIPNTESSSSPSGQWHPLRRDFRPLVAQLFAWPIGAVAFLIIGWLWIHETPALKNIGNNPNALLVELIVALFAIFPIHEFFHVIIHPDFGLSQKTILGAWPSRLLLYAYYDGPRSKGWLLTGIAMPFLVMSVVPLLISIITGHASIIVAFVSSLNALGSGVDIFSILVLMWQVPSRAIVVNRGWQTFWRRPAH